MYTLHPQGEETLWALGGDFLPKSRVWKGGGGGDPLTVEKSDKYTFHKVT